MNLDELRSVRRTERQKDSLQHLRDSFYADAASYIEDLKTERQQAADAADDPFSSPEVGRLTDEIETAEEVVEAIYERRVGKVVKLASFAAADMPTDTEGLTTEERRLFDDLVGRITENRQSVLAMLAGETPAGDADPAPADAGGTAERSTPAAAGEGRTADREPAASTPGQDAAGVGDAAPPEDDVLADAMGGGPDAGPGTADADDAGPGTADADDAGAGAVEADDDDGPREVPPASADEAIPGGPPTPPERPADERGDPPADQREAADDTDRVTVRLTREVGSIFGVDEREYDLARDDVVELPTANAEPLLERDAAERLE